MELELEELLELELLEFELLDVVNRIVLSELELSLNQDILELLLEELEELDELISYHSSRGILRQVSGATTS